MDHIATLRQARGTRYPDPILAASMAELAGADQITVHLREDRRHIQNRDVRLLRQTVQTSLNLEMAVTDEMCDIAVSINPEMVTLVPERREERTTEGGLDATRGKKRLKPFIKALQAVNITVSLFIDPTIEQVTASKAMGAESVELHTGDYCEATDPVERTAELKRLEEAARHAESLGLIVAAGHGLDYKNVVDVAALRIFEEFNIGHSIVSRAVFVGMDRAVREMSEAIQLGHKRGL